jgi:hypothetical protein
MPVLAILCCAIVPDEESDPGSGTCQACGSENLEFLAGYFASGVTGPHGEPETRWQEAVRCRDCGEVQEF